MSFYRSIITAVAAMGLATCVFAADQDANATAQNPADAQQQQAAPALQTADAAPATAAAPAADQAAATQEKVDLNKASAKDLMKVKGMNAAKAKAIVAYRKKHGDFKSIDDLKDVKGFKKISEEKMKQIQGQLTIG